MAALNRKKIPKEVIAVFDRYVDNNVRNLNKPFAIKMLQCEFGLDEDQAETMFKTFDKDQNGIMSIWEFELFFQCMGNCAQEIVHKFKAGVSGYRETQENLEKVSATKSELDEVKGRTLEDMSEMVRRMHAEIAERRNVLAPILREIRPLRERVQSLTPEYDDKKQVYERTSAGLESNMSKLEQEVRGFSEECRAEESRYHYLHCMMGVLRQQQERIAQEMKAYVSHDQAEKKKTLRETYSRKIQEQENLGRNLRERQKTVRENHDPNIKQMKMWRDLERILQQTLQ